MAASLYFDPRGLVEQTILDGEKSRGVRGRIAKKKKEEKKKSREQAGFEANIRNLDEGFDGYLNLFSQLHTPII